MLVSIQQIVSVLLTHVTRPRSFYMDSHDHYSRDRKQLQAINVDILRHLQVWIFCHASSTAQPHSCAMHECRALLGEFLNLVLHPCGPDGAVPGLACVGVKQLCADVLVGPHVVVQHLGLQEIPHNLHVGPVVDDLMYPSGGHIQRLPRLLMVDLQVIKQRGVLV
jgi:hypothetical protein